MGLISHRLKSAPEKSVQFLPVSNFQTERSCIGEQSFINKAASNVDTGNFSFSFPQPYIILLSSFHSSCSKIPILTLWHMYSGTKSLPPYGSSPADCLSPTLPLLPQGFTETERCRTRQSTCHWQCSTPISSMKLPQDSV